MKTSAKTFSALGILTLIVGITIVLTIGLANLRAQTIPAIHWINDASQNASTVLNNGSPFVTSFLGTNDVTVTKLSGSMDSLYTVNFGSSPGNNPGYLTSFTGLATNGTGNGLAGQMTSVVPFQGTIIQLDFAIPLGLTDRILVIDVDGNERDSVQAFSFAAGVYTPVSLSGWTHEPFTGAMGVLPDARWPSWNSATGTFQANSAGNLNDPLDVLAPNQTVDRLIFTTGTSGNGWPTFQVIRLTSDFCGNFRPVIFISATSNAVCWSSCSNALYNVQYSPNLTTTNWINLLTNIIGNGHINCVNDPLPRTEPQRFYRIKVAN